MLRKVNINDESFKSAFRFLMSGIQNIVKDSRGLSKESFLFETHHQKNSNYLLLQSLETGEIKLKFILFDKISRFFMSGVTSLCIAFYHIKISLRLTLVFLRRGNLSKLDQRM